MQNMIYSARNLDLGPDSLLPFSCILSDVVKSLSVEWLSTKLNISKEPKSHSSQWCSGGSDTLLFWKFSQNLSEVTGIGISSVWFPIPTGPFTSIIWTQCCLEGGAFLMGCVCSENLYKLVTWKCVCIEEKALPMKFSIHVAVFWHSFIINGAT